MVQKRPLFDEDLLKVSAKHPRQLENNNELVPFWEFVPSHPALEQPFISGDGGFMKDRTELLVCVKDTETSVPGCLSTSSWTSSSTIEDDVRSENAVYAPLSPGFIHSDHFIRTNVRSEEIYSSLLAYGPRKPVPIGKDHQADIPSWSPQCTADTLNCLNSLEEPVPSIDSDSELAIGKNAEKNLMGVCIIPMPDSESFLSNPDKIGSGKIDCLCHDKSSVRCIKQHISEARENLRRTLGQEKFSELGFSEMGEEVAEKWNDDEEQLFHKVVFSNPASLGKNFWNNLSIVFPSRSRKEIVSYYFNVFMLRRRAEQNRCDPMNIDSDDDEWQGNDDYSEGEDSVGESPVYGDGPCYERNLKDARESGENVQLSKKALWEGRDDHDVQDDSCTSSDVGPAASGARTLAESSENSDLWPSNFYGYVLEPRDARVWETGYMTCLKNEHDFLPTCSMIEEIFRDGDWDLKARDGKDSL